MTKIPVFDGHNDTFLALRRGKRGAGTDFFTRSDEGHLDFERAREGGLAGGFFALFSPSEGDLESLITTTAEGFEFPLSKPRGQAEALADTLELAADLFKAEAASDGRFKIVRTLEALQQCLDDDVMAAIFHIEGAEAIDTDLNALYVLHAAGLRSLGIVWSRENAFGTGVPFSFPAHPDVGPGLSDAGKQLVKTCNDLGIMLDLSHLNERGFWDVASLSSAPLVATHSNVHALSASARNLTDKQLEAVRDSDGVVGLNFSVTFLREDGSREADTPLETMVRHLDYLIDKLGEDRVAFGSDFDGATIPQALGDVTGLPRLLDTLREHGYNEALLKKLASGNWVRVLGKTWH